MPDRRMVGRATLDPDMRRDDKFLSRDDMTRSRDGVTRSRDDMTRNRDDRTSRRNHMAWSLAVRLGTGVDTTRQTQCMTRMAGSGPVV